MMGKLYHLTEEDILSTGNYFDQNFSHAVDAWDAVPLWMPEEYKKYINKKVCVRIGNEIKIDKVYTMKGFAYDIHDFYYVLLDEKTGKTHYETCVSKIDLFDENNNN
jgi:hypothetical protein